MQILPFYMVCDESQSMTGQAIDTINQALPELHHEISTNPTVADKTRFALIGFSSTADVLQPLADLSELSSLPSLSAGGVTSFGEAFRVLRETIEADVAALKAQGHDVYRPVVFFLSDGMPTDGTVWQTEHKALTESAYHPNIIAFGIGQAEVSTMSHVATLKLFMQADNSISPAMALREFASSLARSIVRSAATISPDGFNLVTPDTVPGFTTVSLDKL